jgi:hypothetical protein
MPRIRRLATRAPRRPYRLQRWRRGRSLLRVSAEHGRSPGSYRDRPRAVHAAGPDAAHSLIMTNSLPCPSVTSEGTAPSDRAVLSDVVRAMVRSAGSANDDLIENLEQTIADWKNAYARLYDVADASAETVTTRALERELAASTWRRNAAHPEGAR